MHEKIQSLKPRFALGFNQQKAGSEKTQILKFTLEIRIQLLRKIATKVQKSRSMKPSVELESGF